MAMNPGSDVGIDPAAALSYEDLFGHMLAAAGERNIPIADASPARNAEVVVNGLRLHYLDWGAPSADAPTMLLIHGGTVTAHVWDFFSLSLRDQFHIYAVDLPGHGDSAWAEDADYGRTRLAADMCAFIEALHLPPLVLIGHSLGGSVALLLASQLPQLVRKLVLVDVTMRPLTQLPPDSVLMVRRGPDIFPTMRAFAEHVAGLAPDRDVERLAISMRWNTRQLPDGTWTWKYDRTLRRPPGDSRPSRLADFDYALLWDALRQLKCPVLFVRASHHSHVSEDAATELAAMAPRVQLAVVPRTRHNVMGDNPHAFRETVTAFLGDHGRG